MQKCWHAAIRVVSLSARSVRPKTKTIGPQGPHESQCCLRQAIIFCRSIQIFHHAKITLFSPLKKARKKHCFIGSLGKIFFLHLQWLNILSSTLLFINGISNFRISLFGENKSYYYYYYCRGPESTSIWGEIRESSTGKSANLLL